MSKEIPIALENKPLRYAWMSLYLRAFDVLSSKRLNMFGPQPIQYSEVSRYASDHNIDNLELFEELLSKLDLEYLKHKSKQAEAPKERKKVPKRGGK